MTNRKKTVLAVVGSTASGKTSLAVALAHRLDGEIVCCDSMQIYRRMDIGTAKPTAEEQEGIRHHLFDFVSPKTSYSCADYVTAARACIDEIHALGKLPVLCGGTGLYLDRLLSGGDFEETATDEALRAELFAYAAEHGNAALHRMLVEVDPESAAAIHENNVKRVVRAIEVYRTSGITKSEADRRTKTAVSPYDACVLGLRYADRELLYRRIDLRVEQMLAAGLLEETRQLDAEGIFASNTTAAQAIGYKELLGYLHGECSSEDAVEALKRATRRYAKRQITWFSAKPYVRWLDAVKDGAVRPLTSLCDEAVACFKEHQNQN